MQQHKYKHSILATATIRAGNSELSVAEVADAMVDKDAVNRNLFDISIFDV